jgi:hypothetical protein
VIKKKSVCLSSREGRDCTVEGRTEKRKEKGRMNVGVAGGRAEDINDINEYDRIELHVNV